MCTSPSLSAGVCVCVCVCVSVCDSVSPPSQCVSCVWRAHVRVYVYMYFCGHTLDFFFLRLLLLGVARRLPRWVVERREPWACPGIGFQGGREGGEGWLLSLRARQGRVCVCPLFRHTHTHTHTHAQRVTTGAALPQRRLYLHRLLLQPVNSPLAFPVLFITAPPLPPPSASLY